MNDLSFPASYEQMDEPVIRRGSTCPPDRVCRKRRLSGPFSLISIDQPVSFSRPFIHGANTAYVVRTYEVTRQVRALACRLVPREVSIFDLENSLIASFFTRKPLAFPGHKYPGTTALMVFER
jgi:hypothetical protein